MELNFFIGLGITFLAITVIKVIRYRFRSTDKPLNFYFWGANNWADYIIHLSITAVFIFFEKDTLSVLNPVLLKLVNYQIPAVENKSFLFLFIPVLISTIGYRLARKYISKPIQANLAPKIHNEFIK